MTVRVILKLLASSNIRRVLSTEVSRRIVVTDHVNIVPILGHSHSQPLGVLPHHLCKVSHFAEIGRIGLPKAIVLDFVVPAVNDLLAGEICLPEAGVNVFSVPVVRPMLHHISARNVIGPFLCVLANGRIERQRCSRVLRT